MALLIVFSMQNTMTRLLIWDRLEYDKTQGMISGDNRADSSLKVILILFRVQVNIGGGR